MCRDRDPDPHGPAAVARETSPFYSLWDVETGNALGTYETEREVLDIVRALVDANGPDYAGALDLSTEDLDGNTRHIATGEALLSLAIRTRHSRTS